MTKEFDIEEAVAELTSPSTFNLKAALAKSTSPTESVTIYLDAEAMHEANLIYDEILDLESELNHYKANENSTLAELLSVELSLSAEASGGITDDPEKEIATADVVKQRKVIAAGVKKREKAIALKNAEAETLIKRVLESALKFKLRGLISKQSELLVSKWKRTYKEPARGDYENETDWQADFESRAIARNRAIVVDQIRTAIVSVTGSDGKEHVGGWTLEQVNELWDSIEASEQTKLREMSGNLSFASALFDRAATEDADFLPKA